MYPNPVFSHSQATGTGVGAVIDISSATDPLSPPVMHAIVTGAVTYNIEGSHDNVTWVGYLVGATASVAKDLVIGVRYWRTNVTANAGSFTSSVGPGVQNGKLVQVNLLPLGPDARSV